MQASESSPVPDRVPLRLEITEQETGHPRRGSLDGGWWPQSRDLAVELADLVDHFPPGAGRVSRAVVSPPDWEPVPRRIPVAGRTVKVGSFPRDDTHLVLLRMTDQRMLRLLVVPPDMPDDQASEALLAAATVGSLHPATSILETAGQGRAVDPFNHWNDDGGSWWDPHPIAPSFRTQP